MGGIAGPIQQVANTVGQVPNQLGFGQQPGQVRQTSVPPGQSPFGEGLNKPFVNAPYQPATNMMSEADFNGFLQRQNEMQAADPTANFVNPMTTYQNYVNEVNQGQQTVANNIASAQERARRGMVGFEGPNYTGQPQPGQNPLVNYARPGQPIPPGQINYGFGVNTQPMPQPRPMQQPGSNLMDAIRNAGGRQPMNPNLIPQPQQPQRGLGGLQIDKFKSRLNQR